MFSSSSLINQCFYKVFDIKHRGEPPLGWGLTYKNLGNKRAHWCMWGVKAAHQDKETLIQSKNGPGMVWGAQVWNVDFKFPRYQSNWASVGYANTRLRHLKLTGSAANTCQVLLRWSLSGWSRVQTSVFFFSKKEGRWEKPRFHKLSFFMSFPFWN